MSRVAFIMPIRNKADQVRKNAAAFLGQTQENLDIVFSDHSSEDDSAHAISDVVSGYDGPHNIIRLMAPKTILRGILGYNAHLTWLHETLDHDVFVILSADDIPHPDKVKHCLRVMEETGAEYVAHRVRWVDQEGTVSVESPSFGASRVITLGENIEHQIGIQSGPCWTRTLWFRHAPMQGVEQPELILSSMAATRGKLFLLDEFLHDAVNVPDAWGVSTERAIEAATNNQERMRLSEANIFHMCASHSGVARRVQEKGILLTETDANPLASKLLNLGLSWVTAREKLTMQNIEPMNMRVWPER